MSDAATRLAEAEEALLDILTGKHIRALQDQNGERVEYSRANLPALQAYIGQLKAEAAGLGASGPMGVVF